ncbi:MAG: TonB-dependent receptor plug domain-containing protein [Nocardioides sp.]
MQFRTALKLGVSLAAAAASFNSAAMAQDTAWVDEESKDIVVTGSQIRGIAPAGSNVIGLGEQQIAATGAVTTNDLLAKIPQATNFFNVLPQPGGGTAGGNSVSTINRPNLRNLPGSSTSGAALTLVLFDGHRVVGAGIGTVAVDPDAIPPGAIERVEAITDGGSAVYGSDAIGGVINFITRKRFDGVKVEAHYGFGDDYWTWDANTIVGKDWGSGSIYAAYSYSKHDFDLRHRARLREEHRLEPGQRHLWHGPRARLRRCQRLGRRTQLSDAGTDAHHAAQHLRHFRLPGDLSGGRAASRPSQPLSGALRLADR